MLETVFIREEGLRCEGWGACHLKGRHTKPHYTSSTTMPASQQALSDVSDLIFEKERGDLVAISHAQLARARAVLKELEPRFRQHTTREETTIAAQLLVNVVERSKPRGRFLLEVDDGTLEELDHEEALVRGSKKQGR